MGRVVCSKRERERAREAGIMAEFREQQQLAQAVRDLTEELQRTVEALETAKGQLAQAKQDCSKHEESAFVNEQAYESYKWIAKEVLSRHDLHDVLKATNSTFEQHFPDMLKEVKRVRKLDTYDRSNGGQGIASQKRLEALERESAEHENLM